ncbi:O-methylsterigmatocystin oxidoreductase [Mycena sanguinolenta]|uniref:O-methylsterigmatocystin oxidoreductase n=1 Tax=Mycena sanguinolenta TaxID=230812 RepID=A0A8H7CK70_9AGAR|nr:O-methylsterigmatocystin oxidoreductase [Mycena sanguinolenta]
MGRKAIQPLLAPQAVQAHLPIAEAETTQLLHDILQEPEEFYSHISRSTLSFMTSVVFGKPAPRHDSPEAMLFREYVHQLSKTISPEAAPVDLVPLLKYVPEWWAPWKQLWRETRRLQRSLYFGFLEQAEQRIYRGLRNETFIEKILDRQEEFGLDREMIAYICGVLLDGGAETLSSFLQSLVLCLVRSPASLRKAQEEIDNVVGNERLPVSSDLQALPYVQAVIKETHRFRPVGPTAVPHATTNDCQYREYIIPKGAPVFINIWGIFHDPNIFECPDEFWPDRYLLTHDGAKPGLSNNYSIRASLPFGSGKSLAVMRLLWAFDFAPIDDSVPQPSIEHEYNDGLTLTPKPFQCKITPRSKEKVEVIEECYRRNASSGHFFMMISWLQWQKAKTIYDRR